MIFIAITRTGKETKHVEVEKNSTVEAAFQKAGFSRTDYADWTITDEDGDSLQLTDVLTNSGQLIVGKKVSGAA